MKPLSSIGVFTCLLILLPSALMSFRLDAVLHRTEVENVSLENFPKTLGEWQGEDTTELDARSQSILQLDEYLRRRYTTADNHSAFVYVGYWKKQSGEHQAAKHSPLMCFPANGLSISHPEERFLSSTAVTTNASRFSVSRLVAKDKDRSSLYYYWFFSGEETYHDEFYALLYVLHSTIVNGRSDGGIVEISTPIADSADTEKAQAEAEETLQKFAAVFVPELSRTMKGGDAK